MMLVVLKMQETFDSWRSLDGERRDQVEITCVLNFIKGKSVGCNEWKRETSVICSSADGMMHYALISLWGYSCTS